MRSILKKSKNILPKNNKRNFSTCLTNNATVVGSPAEIPLTSFYPGIPESKHHLNNAHEEQLVYKPQQSTLENGLNIISTDSTTNGTSVVSLVVNAGSRHETYQSNGASHFVSKFFFSSTNQRSLLRLVSELQKTGANVSAQTGRENIVYQTEALKSGIPYILELVTNSVLQSRLHEWDLPPKIEAVKRDIEDFHNSSQLVLNEALHYAAFNGETLGNTVVCPSHNLNRINTDTILNYMDTLFVAPRMTLVGTNYSHDELRELGSILLGNIPTDISSQQDICSFAKSKYYGGDFQVNELASNSPYQTQAILAYQGPTTTDADLAAYQVLQNYLGQVGTLKKGIDNNASRLAKTVNNIQYGSAFITSYSDNGLFGVYLGGNNGLNVSKAVEQVVTELRDVDKNLGSEELLSAKNQALARLYESVTGNFGLHEYVAAFGDVAKQAEAIKSVTEEQVRSVAKKLLQTPPTLVSYGNLQNMIKTRNLH
ncbi:hypothetical protein ABK040_015153 [Willaertia magna]